MSPQRRRWRRGRARPPSRQGHSSTLPGRRCDNHRRSMHNHHPKTERIFFTIIIIVSQVGSLVGGVPLVPSA